MAAMPLDAHRITHDLYQGSSHSSLRAVRHARFSVLVLCAQEIQPPRSALPGLHVIRCPIDDGESVPPEDWRLAQRAGERVAQAWRGGHRVLVTCHQGWNRSGLVSAIALHSLTGRDGCTCAAQVQRRRPGALRNRAFVEALCSRLR